MTHDKSRRPNQADVARLAGVSTAVVSYVVNNGPRPVSREARERVNRAIRSLDYHPNASARALRSGDSRLIGVAVPEVSNPYQAEIVEHIAEYARKQGLGTLLVSTGNTPENERLALSGFRSRGIDGLITSSLKDPSLYPEFAELVPTAVFNPEGQIPQCHGVGPDSRPATAMATRHLIEHGHRRIGLIIGPLEPWRSNGREMGWADGLRQAGLPLGPIEHEPWTREGGYRALTRLLESPVPPTAIIAGSDLLAVGALRAARDRGLNVPDDLAIVSFDGTPEALYASPQLTTLVQPIGLMVKCAVDLILTGALTPSLHLFPLELRVGASCGCPVPDHWAPWEPPIQ